MSEQWFEEMETVLVVYFVQESTQGAIDAGVLVGRLEAFIADSASERRLEFAQERLIPDPA